MSASLVIGIDPGLHGALAFRFERGLVVHNMPIFEIARGGKKKHEVDPAGLAQLLESGLRSGTASAFVEQVGAMPGQGVTSMFAFGQSYGIILGVLAALRIPYTRVPPITWKKAMGVRGGKDASRARASELMPEDAATWKRVKDEGRAEAALIALYGLRQLERVPA
jgi:crossover junction endodeoxyribonuclease RuvC